MFIIFSSPATIAAIIMMSLATGITDSLKHAAYPPLGPRKAKPNDRKAASWFWSFDSVFNGCLLQIGILSILNPPSLSLLWLANLVSTLIVMMLIHQVLFAATDRVMFRSGIRRPFPDGKKHLHNFWSSPAFDLHIGNRGLLIFNVGAVVFFILLETAIRIF